MTMTNSFPLLTVIFPAMSRDHVRPASATDTGVFQWRGPDGRLYKVVAVA